MDDMQQFRETYIAECYELLAEMEEKLMGLDDEETDLDELNAIFRCAHSIKGGAGAFGFTRITQFTHILEALLDGMREGKLSASRQSIDALLHSVDIVTQLVKAAQAGEEMPAGFENTVKAELEAISSNGAVAIAPVAAAAAEAHDDAEIMLYSIDFKPHKNLFSTGNEPLLLARELATLGTFSAKVNTENLPPLHEMDHETCYLSWTFDVETNKPSSAIKEVFEFVEDECDLVITELAGLIMPPKPSAHQASTPQEAAPPPSSTPKAEKEDDAKAPAAGKPMGATSVRVDLDKIDRLVNMVGELVITQAVIMAQSKNLPVDQFPELLNGIDELSQHSRELQEAVMSVRMQPVKTIFSRMPRIVRDISGKLGKNIELQMFGEATEIDKTVIEQLSDPLTHMIRNSVDHGIEMPDARRAKGKPEQGTIRLSADHRGGRIVIEIEDDGNGINREIVLSKAIEKGLVSPDAQLSPEEIDNLIFHPGFSTAAVVSDISGRGVGMDVVRKNIEGLGGTVAVHNRPGQGSTMSVTLPLTLAILDGMIVRIGREHYIIPINNIIETLRPRAEEIRKIADGNDLINIRGDFTSILYLHKYFNIKNAITDPSEALIVLVENGRDKIGLVVDELIGQQQVVIKTLKEYASAVKGISGATILGDGKVSLILDVAELQSLARANDRERESKKEGVA
jgi:two-component system chemotaxis sensor kinase CheA